MASTAELMRVECRLSRWGGWAKRCQWCNVALTGTGQTKRRRTWCSEKCYEMFQAHHVWSHAKLLAFRKARNTCQAKDCTVSGEANVKVYHLSPLGSERYGMSCQHHQENLIVLCTQHGKSYKGKVFI